MFRAGVFPKWDAWRCGTQGLKLFGFQGFRIHPTLRSREHVAKRGCGRFWRLHQGLRFKAAIPNLHP